MTIQNIVVGTDFSEASENAITQAMHIARKTGATITLVHAGDLPQAKAEVPEHLSSAAEEFETLVRESASADRNALEELRERLDGQGVEISHALVQGFPDVGITETAKQVGADLVITGTHGRTGIKRFLLGSVAERVVRMSETSVLVSRNDSGAGGFKKILVPTDFTELSMRAIDIALELAAPDATIELFHSWQLPPQANHRAAEAVLKPIMKAIEADVDKRGDELKKSVVADGRTVRFTNARKAPADGIQDRLAADDFDIVIMGSHGRRGIQRFFLGSVAEATIRHATCSVLIAHQARD
jgi:nucleotide-binding universal stress UspA family protein